MKYNFQCQECGKLFSPLEHKFRCECGGLLKLSKFEQVLLETTLTLGEGDTPIIKKEVKDTEIFFKMDYLMPTGSFKDRGAVVLMDQLSRTGVKEIVEDSSGNAGAAIAAYATAADIKCTIYLPQKTSKKKIEQIKAYGAEIKKVRGDRYQASLAVKETAQKIYYASHIYNPFFIAGITSLAYELKEVKPDIIFIPIGNGTLLLGLYYGFKKIGGYMPQLIGVQALNCSPVYDYMTKKTSDYKNVEYNHTIAGGIAVSDPPRKIEIIQAVNKSSGEIIIVSESLIKKASKILNKKGIYVEPTAAVGLAGFMKYLKKEKISNKKVVIPLTGSGLKK